MSGKKKFLLAVVSVLALAIMGAGGIAFFINTPAGDGKNVQILDFPEGYSLKKFAGDLEQTGVISNARLFSLYARIRGADARVKAGSYRVSDGLSPADILRKLVKGDIFAYRFTVPEGYSMYQVAELLEARGLYKKKAFLEQCTNRELLGELGIGGKSVEGYLYPSTYTIPPRTDEAGFIRMMVSQFDRVYFKTFAGKSDTGLSLRAIITLASIIEKEAVVPTERPLIASVFRNRLKIGMPLQSDPTAVYGFRAFTGKVSKQDIMRKSPYNTYLVKGLPPGPIGNPGSEAIQAALAPAATPYFYFVAKQDGSHYFSRTLDEHNNAVRKYLR